MSRRSQSPRSSVRTILSTLALAIGSLLPFIIAWVLIASTNDDNPLDAIPDYGGPLQETVTLSEYQFTTARSEYEYRNTVRLIIEGTLTLDSGAVSDGFFTFTTADGAPLESPVLNDWALTVEGEPLAAALNLDAISYDDDHVYTGLYAVGNGWKRLTFGTTPDAPGSGDLRITVIQVD